MNQICLVIKNEILKNDNNLVGVAMVLLLTQVFDAKNWQVLFGLTFTCQKGAKSYFVSAFENEKKKHVIY